MNLVGRIVFSFIVLGACLNSHLAWAEVELKASPVSTGRLLFTLFKEGKGDIYQIDFSKGAVTALVATPASEEYPTFSPDGDAIAFYSNASGDNEIYTVAADGSQLTRLTKSTGADEDPSWSPDGKQIVFQSERLGSGSANVFIMERDGSKPVALTNSQKKNTVPRWSPRGDEILYSTSSYWPGWDIMLLDIGSKKSRLLSDGLQSFCRGSWSPDGHTFIYSYGSGGSVDLYLQDKGKGESTQLTDIEGREYDPVWTPDGSGVFFVHELTKGRGDFQIFFIDMKTRAVTQVTSGHGSKRYLSYTSLPALPTRPLETGVSNEAGRADQK